MSKKNQKANENKTNNLSNIAAVAAPLAAVTPAPLASIEMKVADVQKQIAALPIDVQAQAQKVIKADPLASPAVQSELVKQVADASAALAKGEMKVMPTNKAVAKAVKAVNSKNMYGFSRTVINRWICENIKDSTVEEAMQVVNLSKAQTIANFSEARRKKLPASGPKFYMPGYENTPDLKPEERAELTAKILEVRSKLEAEKAAAKAAADKKASEAKAAAENAKQAEKKSEDPKTPKAGVSQKTAKKQAK